MLAPPQVHEKVIEPKIERIPPGWCAETPSRLPRQPFKLSQPEGSVPRRNENPFSRRWVFFSDFLQGSEQVKLQRTFGQ